MLVLQCSRVGSARGAPRLIPVLLLLLQEPELAFLLLTRQFHPGSLRSLVTSPIFQLDNENL